MITDAIKQSAQDAVFDFLSGELPAFEEMGDTNLYQRQSTETFRHPSVLVACEEAPILQEDLGIHEAKVDIYVTSPTLDMAETGETIDASAEHAARVGLVEEFLSRRADIHSFINTGPAAIRSLDDPELMDFEGFQSDRHWVDKATLTVYCQIRP